MKKSVWLHNIRSVYNVGSIFRTADALGINHIYLSGYTPLPIDRFGRARNDMHKVAIGAEKNISWSQLENPKGDIIEMRKNGTYLVAIEQDTRAVNVFEYQQPEVSELVMVMGEETLGMEPWQLELCDDVLEIPMHGEKESLNVSVAFGVAGYLILGK